MVDKCTALALNILYSTKRGIMQCLCLGVLMSLFGCSGATLWNLASQSTAKTIKTDIIFDSRHSLATDIYYSKAPAKGTIIFIYGGSWRTGNKDMYRFVADGLLKYGYDVVIPSYRLYPDAAYPEFISDIETFMLWLHENHRQQDIRLQNVFIMGHSAGAYNAAMYLTDNAFAKPFAYNGFIGLAGPYDFFLPTKNPEYQPIFSENGNYNSSASLPVNQPAGELDSHFTRALLLHGANDDIVTPKNIDQFASYLKARHIEVTTRIYDDMDHRQLIGGVNNVPLAPRTVRNDIINFIEPKN